MRVESWSERNDGEFRTVRTVRNEPFKDHWSAAPMPADAWKNKITN